MDVQVGVLEPQTILFRDCLCSRILEYHLPVELLLCTDIVLRVVFGTGHLWLSCRVVAVPLAAHVVSCTHQILSHFIPYTLMDESSRDTVRVKGYEMPLPQLRFERC
jgi:hypothetical protein